MDVNERLRDDLIRHAIYADRYADAQLKEIIKVLQSVVKNIEQRIASEPNVVTIAWLNQVKGWIEQQAEIFTSKLENGLKQAIKELISHEGELFTRDMYRAISVKFNYTIPAPEVIERAVLSMPVDSGHLYDELMKRYDQLTKDYIISEIRAGIVSGEGIKEMVHRLTSLLSIQAASAERMVRSVVMHTMNTARLELYKANRDVIKAVQYVATLDTKNCLVCGTLDGKTWDLDEQHPTPPMHYNCRCVLAPITKSWRELGIDKDEIPPTMRSSMNGYVPETMDYTEWLAKQSEKTQAEILGPTRLKLYKQGLPIEKMVRNGKPLTIEELRQKEFFD